MNRVVRASATFPPDLLEEFDQTTKVMGYKRARYSVIFAKLPRARSAPQLDRSARTCNRRYCLSVYGALSIAGHTSTPSYPSPLTRICIER